MSIPCGACGGDGVISTPTAALDPNGNPMIEQVVTTCIACNGNGKVEVQ